MKQIDIEIHSPGDLCRITLNGQLIPCRKAVITMEVGELTRIELDCWKLGGEPYIIKGLFVEDE